MQLAEVTSRLGGRLDLARRPPGREEWGRLIDHKVGAVKSLGVAIRLGQWVDADFLRQYGPDFVILATGAEFPPLAIAGADNAPILTVDDAVANPEQVGQRVLILDYLDRQPAMVTAIMLAEMGRAVEIATPSFHVGQKLEIQNITYFYQRALSAGVQFRSTSLATRFDGGTVTFTNPFSKRKTEAGPFDAIVVAHPGRPRDGLATTLQDLRIPHRVIGDAYAPRDAEAAGLEGLEAGAAI